jgi:hypothetical protein
MADGALRGQLNQSMTSIHSLLFSTSWLLLFTACKLFLSDFVCLDRRVQFHSPLFFFYLIFFLFLDSRTARRWGVGRCHVAQEPSRGGIYLSFGDGTAPDRLQIAALATGAAPHHLQMGTLATSARTGTTAEAPGPILTDRLSLALPKGAGVARTYPNPLTYRISLTGLPEPRHFIK